MSILQAELNIVNKVKRLVERKDLDWNFIKTSYGKIYANNIKGFYIEIENDIMKVYIGYSLVLIVDIKDLSNEFYTQLHKIELDAHEERIREFLSL